jgi:hypothetical protein
MMSMMFGVPLTPIISFICSFFILSILDFLADLLSTSISVDKTIFDYIITKQDLKLKIQDVRACRGPHCGTDHKLLVAKILFPYMYTSKDQHEEKKENTAMLF